METAYERGCRRISEQEDRIVRQERLIESMTKSGRSTDEAKQLLYLMRFTLSTFQLSLRHLSDR